MGCILGGTFVEIKLGDPLASTAFFRVVCRLKARALVPPDAEIQKPGFSRHRRMTGEWGLLKSEWWRRG
jgi:hypothetical protein